MQAIRTVFENVEYLSVRALDFDRCVAEQGLDMAVESIQILVRVWQKLLERFLCFSVQPGFRKPD